MSDQECQALLDVIAYDALLSVHHTDHLDWWLWESRTGLCSSRPLAEARQMQAVFLDARTWLA